MFSCRSRAWPARGRALVVALALSTASGAVAPQMLVNTTRSLDFGRFVAGSGGTVTVAPSGLRTSTGGVVLLTSPTAGAAGFMLVRDSRNTPNQAIAITLPPDGSIRLGSGNNSMPVNVFVPSPSVILSLPVAGQPLAVGATMTVAPNQPGGNYSGSFSLIVNFQ